ncbi:MAG: hypothetical protein GX587_08990 [Bacteroidales bacterium]|nr:hypothetical protein [Bacteroidales bacterium]
MNAREITPEGLNVYRKRYTRRTYDPGRGRTLLNNASFFTYTIKQGMVTIPINRNHFMYKKLEPG